MEVAKAFLAEVDNPSFAMPPIYEAYETIDGLYEDMAGEDL